MLHYVLINQSLVSFHHRIFDALYPLQPLPSPSPLITTILLSVSYPTYE